MAAVRYTQHTLDTTIGEEKTTQTWRYARKSAVSWSLHLEVTDSEDAKELGSPNRLWLYELLLAKKMTDCLVQRSKDVQNCAAGTKERKQLPIQRSVR